MKKIISSILSLCLILNLVYINPSAVYLKNETLYTLNEDTIYTTLNDTDIFSNNLAEKYTRNGDFIKGEVYFFDIKSAFGTDWWGRDALRDYNFNHSLVGYPFVYLGDVYGKNLFIAVSSIGEKNNINSVASRTRLGRLGSTVIKNGKSLTIRYPTFGANPVYDSINRIYIEPSISSNNEMSTIYKSEPYKNYLTNAKNKMGGNTDNSYSKEAIIKDPLDTRTGDIPLAFIGGVYNSATQRDSADGYVLPILELHNIPPTISSVNLNNADWTNNEIDITINANDQDGDTLSYSIDGVNFQNSNKFKISTPSISANGTSHTAYVSDGKNGSVTGSFITKIDTIAPLDFTINISDTNPTNTNVTVNLSGGIDNLSGFSHFSISDENGINFTNTNSKTINKNGIYKAHAYDNAGNFLEKDILISNIDKTSPTIQNINYNTSPTNKDLDVYISAFDKESGISEYSLDNTNWQKSNMFIIVTNGIYTAYVKDGAGNVSQTQFTISNIDKTPPVINDIYHTEHDANINIYVSAIDTLSGIYGYSLDSNTWQLNNRLTVFDYDQYTIYIKDNAGNISSIKYDINKPNLPPVTPPSSGGVEVTPPPCRDINNTIIIIDNTKYIHSIKINDPLDIFKLIEDKVLHDRLKALYDSGLLSIATLQNFVVPVNIATGKIVQKSIFDKDTVKFIANEPGEYKLIFNYKEYVDIDITKSEARYVAFVSSREIMLGTTFNTFDINSLVTGDMLYTVLGRIRETEYIFKYSNLPITTTEKNIIFNTFLNKEYFTEQSDKLISRMDLVKTTVDSIDTLLN